MGRVRRSKGGVEWTMVEGGPGGGGEVKRVNVTLGLISLMFAQLWNLSRE